MSEHRFQSLCQGCGNTGPMTTDEANPAWCTCVPKRGHSGGGPYVAAPGSITRFTFMTKDEAAWRDRCRLAGKAERGARDAITDARYTETGRKRPDSSPLVRAAVKAYRAALRELETLQAQCSHPSRSMFSPVHCDVCYAQVECNVEHFRHVVREIGKRAAMRLAI